MVCIYIFLIMGYIFNIGSLINLLFNIDWNDFEIVSKEPDDYCTPLQHRVLRTITCASKIKLKQKVPLSTPYLRSSWDGDRRKLRLLLWGLILQVWANKVSLCKAEFLKICLSRTGYYSDLKIDARHRGLSVFLLFIAMYSYLPISLLLCQLEIKRVVWCVWVATEECNTLLFPS